MNRAYLWSGLRSPLITVITHGAPAARGSWPVHHHPPSSSTSGTSIPIPGWPGVESRQVLHSRTWNGPSFFFPLQLQTTTPSNSLPLFFVTPLASKVRGQLILYSSASPA